ncbi:MAG: hypothetical protein WAU68_08100 [Vitreimonas sp.]
MKSICDAVTHVLQFFAGTPARRTLLFFATLIAAAFVCGVMVPHDAELTRDYFAVFVLGAALGVSDVFSRYQEAPLRTLGSPGAITRIATNALASGLALWLIKANPEALRTIPNPAAQIIAAGFGALVLLRVSIRFRFSGQDLSIGPAELIDSILAAADRDANRSSALATALDAYEVRRLVLYNDVVRRLAPICIELPQTLSPTQKQTAYNDIKACVDRDDCEDKEKTLLILAIVARLVGWEVVKGVAREMARDGNPLVDTLAKQSDKAS